MDMRYRSQLVKSMEFIARHINDENILFDWLAFGVADCDIIFGDTDDETLVDEYYTDDENFPEIMQEFLYCMSRAYKSGGLYCDKKVSKWG